MSQNPHETSRELPPFSREEILQNFTSDKLKSASLEEYIELLKRVPTHFVTHITRHGFRDHSSHHNYDNDSNFHHGFEGLLKDQTIKSVLENMSEGSWTKETVRYYLHILGIPESFENKSDARMRLYEFTDLPSNPWIKSEFADNNAVHGAIDHVADFYYGTEDENQIFIIYPAAFIASQYKFTGQNGSVPENFSVDKNFLSDDRNDIWMMQKEDKKGSLPIESGIIFIPADTQVDPKTGSKYATDNNEQQLEGKPLANDTITSKEYWEKYFQENGYRPKKIIFYSDKDPNQALESFKKQYGLNEDSHQETNLTEMFKENITGQVQMKDELEDERNKFKKIAQEIIDELYE